ncbi:MAG: YraN family protein [Clostridia bacterium]|nr:YraN family protein [Clostridia bacterium]
MNTKKIGDYGEDCAAKYLSKNGYKIVKRNYKTKFCEIDIIAYDGDCLCFVEVKTRNREDYGLACEAVDYKKRQKIIKGALFYTSVNGIDAPVRFDVAEVYINSSHLFSTKKINIIKNAFDASGAY